MGVTPDNASKRKTQNHLILEFGILTLNVNTNGSKISKNIGMSSKKQSYQNKESSFNCFSILNTANNLRVDIC